jgi:GxxExxY protein
VFPTRAEIEHVTERIIGCAIEVHRTLGAGLLESVYRECMTIEMLSVQLRVESERQIKLAYKGKPINSKLRIDLLVEGMVVVELKAIECIHPIHLSQVITYVKLSDCPAGLLLNFNVAAMNTGVKRLEHPDLYTQKKRSPPNLLPSCS